MFELAETETVNVTTVPELITDLSALTVIAGVLAADAEIGIIPKSMIATKRIERIF